MRTINQLVVHCSDTPPTMDIGAHEINEWHVARGWACIGYHYVVRRNGLVELGRPLAMIGAHVAGHNQNSIGICMVGSKGDHTPEQWSRTAVLLADLSHQFSIPPGSILGHRDFSGVTKTCPDFDVRERLIPAAMDVMATEIPTDDHVQGDP